MLSVSVNPTGVHPDRSASDSPQLGLRTSEAVPTHARQSHELENTSIARAPRPRNPQLTQVRLLQSHTLPTHPDDALRKTLTHWLMTGKLNANPLPANASIKPFVDAFSTAVRAPQVQAWLKSKGLDLSTARVFSDGVEGTVLVDGARVTRRFTTTDGSGWWEVAAKVIEAVNRLSPDNVGVLLPDEKTGRFRHVDVILDFYGVKPPADPADGVPLGKQLHLNGWPAIPDLKRTQWRQQFEQLQQINANIDTRALMASQLQAQLSTQGEGDSFYLGTEPAVLDPQSTLAQKSRLPRERFVQWLATPAFKAFIERIGLNSESHVYRVFDGRLEIRSSGTQWRSLQDALDDEVSRVQLAGNRDELAAIDTLVGELNQLVALCKPIGNTLYSLPMYDMRQFLVFSGLGCPATVAQAKAAIGWLNTRLPPAPATADYARLSPYTWGPGALSPQDLARLKSTATGPGSVTELLVGYLADKDVLNDQPQLLQRFFDSPQACAKAQELAQQLDMIEAADGQALSRASRHQLLASVIKASVTAQMPGRPGEVAGYDIYQPNNLGRTVNDVRGDIQTHLKTQGADEKTAPLIAHLLLAQAAPEFLLSPDPGVPAQASEALKLSPGHVSLGSAAWMNLRLGCAIAEKLGGAGSSRSLTLTQAHALARLEPMGEEHALLIKSLGTQPLLEWAVMNGVFPRVSDGRYSAGNYQAAAQAFADRRARLGVAFKTLTREPPTQVSLLIEQLARLFPEMTPEEIANARLGLVTDLSLKSPDATRAEDLAPRLTDVILAQQTLDPVLALSVMLGMAKTYTFTHPTISQETFDDRIKTLPSIKSLVAPAVDRYLADTRSAQETVVRTMIANAPLEVRRALEVGTVELFTLREETGQPVSEDARDSARVAQKIARHGVLLRYETGAATPRFGFLEVFPGSMKMIRRLLPSNLALDGVIEKGPVPLGPFAYTQVDMRKANQQPLDLQAYKTGQAPRSGVYSQAIIEKFGATLPGRDVTQWPTATPVYVPNSWASNKTSAIAKAIVDATFNVKREPLTEYANQPTSLQKRLGYPFMHANAYAPENLKTVLSLIPFVGAIADLTEGKIGAGLKGFLLDFASFALTGGLSGARNFFKGVKAVMPFSSRTFTLSEVRGAGQFFRSVFNPLDGASDSLKIVPSAIDATKRIWAGEVVSLGSGFFLTTSAFEQCRWGVGVYDTLAAAATGRTTRAYPGSRMGWSQNSAVQATRINAKWYAIDRTTQQPTGAPLADFRLDAPER